MQFTLEEINKEIETVQQDAGNLQSRLQQLIGYRQALIDLNKQEDPAPDAEQAN